jgi:hypothetical protein
LRYSPIWFSNLIVLCCFMCQTNILPCPLCQGRVRRRQVGNGKAMELDRNLWGAEICDGNNQQIINHRHEWYEYNGLQHCENIHGYPFLDKHLEFWGFSLW